MRAPFVWSEVFSVGHARLDDQHRGLVDLIGRFCTAAHADEGPMALAALLNAIKRATRGHLRYENAVLRALKAGAAKPTAAWHVVPRQLRAVTDAAIEDHIDEHHRMLDRLLAIEDRIDTVPRPDGPTLCTDVKAWFLDHAVKHDAHLKTIFQAL